MNITKEKIIKKLNKKNILKIAIILCILGAELMAAYFFKTLYYNNGLISHLVPQGEDAMYLAVDNDTVFEYPITGDAEMIRALFLRFQAGADGTGAITSGEILIQVTDETTGQVLRSSAVLCTNVSHFDFFVVDLGEPIINGDDTKLKITVSFANLIEDQVYMLCSPQEDGGAYPVTMMTIAGHDAFQTVICIIFALIIIATAYALISGMFSKEFRLERVYLVVGLCLGMAISLLLPLLVAPDEKTHSDSAYHVSNVILGVDESEDGHLVMRADDYNMSFAELHFDRRYYMDYYGSFFQKVEDEALVQTDRVFHTRPYYLFIPTGLGITIGRLLNMGPIFTYMLGRWMGLLCFVLAVYFAMKKIPFGKAIMFVWACLPITLQQSMAFTYDSPILSLSIITIALTLNLMYSHEELSRAKRIRDIVILVVACLLLVPCKAHALLPIPLLPLMVIVKVLYDRRHRIKEFICKKNSRKIIFIASSVAVVLGVALVAVYVLKSLLANAHGLGYNLWWIHPDVYSHTPGYYLMYPKELIKMIMNTFSWRGETLIMEAFGASLGWLNQPVPNYLIIGYMFLFVFASIRRTSEDYNISLLSRAWMMLVFLGVCFLSIFGMLIAWTATFDTVIKGTQGRYFLPALVLFGICLRTKNTVRGDDSDKTIACILPMFFLVMSISMFLVKIV